MREEHYVMNCITKQNLRQFEKIIVLSILFVGLALVSLAMPVMATVFDVKYDHLAVLNNTIQNTHTLYTVYGTFNGHATATEVCTSNGYGFLGYVSTYSWNRNTTSNALSLAWAEKSAWVPSSNPLTFYGDEWYAVRQTVVCSNTCTNCEPVAAVYMNEWTRNATAPPPSNTTFNGFITVSPDTIAPNGTATGTINVIYPATTDLIYDIGWKWSDAATPYYNEFYDNGNTSRPLQYTKKGTTWYGLDNLANDFIVNKGTAIPNPVTLSGITTSGEKIIRCVIFTSDGNSYILTAPLTVSGQTVSTGAKLIDALTGNYIVGGTISFQNVATGAWTNQTTTSDGKVYVSSSPTVKWNLYGNASGYTTVSRLGLDSSSPGSVNVYALTMYPSAYISAPGGETTLLATVTAVCQQQYQGACSDLPLGGVTITITSVDGVTFSQSATTGTGTSGTITMFIPNMTAYFWGASGKAGYESVSGNFTVNAEPVYTLGIQMAQIFVTPTPSLAPGQTPMPTGVTPTQTKGATQSEGEFQAFRAFDAIAGALWGWVQIAIGIVSIWLLWILVYEMTGGKVIEKIMRRGRKR